VLWCRVGWRLTLLSPSPARRRWHLRRAALCAALCLGWTCGWRVATCWARCRNPRTRATQGSRQRSVRCVRTGMAPALPLPRPPAAWLTRCLACPPGLLPPGPLGPALACPLDALECLECPCCRGVLRAGVSRPAPPRPLSFLHTSTCIPFFPALPSTAPQILDKVRRLALDDSAVIARERRRVAAEGPVDAPWPVKATFGALCWVLDVAYAGRPIQVRPAHLEQSSLCTSAACLPD
jgi:hypothetical protein